MSLLTRNQKCPKPRKRPHFPPLGKLSALRFDAISISPLLAIPSRSFFVVVFPAVRIPILNLSKPTFFPHFLPWLCPGAAPGSVPALPRLCPGSAPALPRLCPGSAPALPPAPAPAGKAGGPGARNSFFKSSVLPPFEARDPLQLFQNS